MRSTFRFVVLAAGIVSAASTALAENRLFTVRTNQPGVTITDAYRNGRQLALGGRNGADSVFRIDNPAGQVPCTNRIQFVASNGQTIDTTANLCSVDWDLTISLTGAVIGGGQGPGTPPPAPPPGPAAQTTRPGFGQPVVIATDDTTVTILNVFLRGAEVPITARQDPYVQINVLSGPNGFECQRDLGLALSDGRRIARLVDVCQTRFLVVVPLVGGPRPPPPPPSMQPPAAQLPPQQPLPPQAPQPPQVPGTPDFVDDMVWLFSATQNRATLAYAIPNSDGSEFVAACAPRSGKTIVTLDRSADELFPGGTVPVRLAAGAFRKDYTGRGTEVSQLDGLSHPAMAIAANDPLWAALIKESALGIVIGSADPYGISLKGSAAKVKQFLSVCSVPVLQPAPLPPAQPPVLQPPPVVAPPIAGPVAPPMLPTMPGTSNYACDDGTFLQISFDDSSAAVSELGEPPVILFAVPSPSGGHWVAGPYDLREQAGQVVWGNGGYTRYCVEQ